jgi:DNA invertase Pin-like site-specific DNA recombinase
VSRKPAPATGRLVGYARVSTQDQTTALQLDALRSAGCSEIHQDRVSGSVVRRPGLDAALASLGPGDVLVVWRLDRLGRSLAHLVELVSELQGRGVGFRSLSDAIDTTSAGGRLVFHIMASLAEFERSLIGERTRAGMAAARARGSMVGRRRALTPAQLDHARLLIERGESPSVVARSLGCGRSTLYRSLGAKKTAPAGVGAPGRA